MKKKKYVDTTITFTGRRQVPGSVLNEICKAVGNGMVSGSMQLPDGMRLSWKLLIEVNCIGRSS